MTSRRDVQTKLQQLHDVREILASMKNLAYMETRKLAPRLESQREAVRLVELAAADFLAHFPQIHLESGEPLEQTLIVLGSERGFCGAFNEQLTAAVNGDEKLRLLAVGRKLTAKLEQDRRYQGSVEGAIVAEESDEILGALVSRLGALGSLTLTLLFHDENGEVMRLALLPPFRNLPSPPKRATPPLLNLSPRQFFVELVDQYLFAVLHQALYASLLAENQQRVRHLEGAVQRLDDQLAELERRRHRLRQEEITEEIEVILLNVELK